MEKITAHFESPKGTVGIGDVILVLAAFLIMSAAWIKAAGIVVDHYGFGS